MLIQYCLYPVFGISVPARDAFAIAAIIVLIAFVKNFAIRRFFNYLHLSQLGSARLSRKRMTVAEGVECPEAKN